MRKTVKIICFIFDETRNGGCVCCRIRDNRRENLRKVYLLIFILEYTKIDYMSIS